MEFGLNLGRILEKRGFKQNSFAKLIDESPNQLNMVIRGKRAPSIKMINKIVDVFPELDLNELFKGEELLNSASEPQSNYMKPEDILDDIEKKISQLRAHMTQ